MARARHPHRRINVGAAGQRVADGAADAGGGPAERFDLRRVVVRLIFEKQQPRLCFPVDFHVDLHGAGIDLVGFVELFKLSCLFQRLCRKCRDIH